MSVKKTIIVLFLIIWFSFTLMMIAHESWHLFQFRTQGSEIEQICFLGHMRESIEIDNEIRDIHAIGWTWAETPYVRATEWDAWFIGVGVMFASAMTLTQILFTKKKPVCFGTKQFNQTSNICLGCDLRTDCRREFLNNHRMVRY